MPERKIEYQTLEHKADSGFQVTAPSLARLYIDAALALTDMMVKLDLIKEVEKRTLSVTGENRDQLMVKWLNEILFLFEKEKILCRRIVFDTFDGKKIAASIHGEKFDPPRHGGISEIKAVTYHQLQLGDKELPEPHFFARIFLDL
jgi:SHS2 domain-containing protein